MVSCVRTYKQFITFGMVWLGAFGNVENELGRGWSVGDLLPWGSDGGRNYGFDASTGNG